MDDLARGVQQKLPLDAGASAALDRLFKSKELTDYKVALRALERDPGDGGRLDTYASAYAALRRSRDYRVFVKP